MSEQYDYEVTDEMSADRRTQRALFLVMGILMLLVAAAVLGVRVLGGRGGAASQATTAQISSAMVRPQPTLTTEQIAMTAVAPSAAAAAPAVDVVVEPVIPVVSITTVPRPPISLEQPAGMLSGIVHGLISPFTFFLSLITPTIRMYDPMNSGFMYDFGFLIGVAALLFLINWWFSRRGRAHRKSTKRHAA